MHLPTNRNATMFINPKNIVVIYSLIVFTYTFLFIYQNKFSVELLDSSGLGGFLSGLFAPMVFLYLILGHKQQEEALNKTNNDLLKQLKIQKDMLQLQLDDKKEREFLTLPIIEMKVKKYDEPMVVWNESSKELIKNYENANLMLEIQLKNSGSEVLYFSCNNLSPFSLCLNNQTKFKKDETLTVKVKLDNLKYDSQGKMKLTFQNDYITSTGIPYFNLFEVIIFESDKNYFEYSSFGPIKSLDNSTQTI